MFCDECGAKIPNNAQYCWQCGKPQPLDFSADRKYLVITKFSLESASGDDIHWKPGDIFDYSKYDSSKLSQIAKVVETGECLLVKEYDFIDEESGVVIFSDGSHRQLTEIINEVQPTRRQTLDDEKVYYMKTSIRSGICKNETGKHCFKADSIGPEGPFPDLSITVFKIPKDDGTFDVYYDHGKCPYAIWNRKQCPQFYVNTPVQ